MMNGEEDEQVIVNDEHAAFEENEFHQSMDKSGEATSTRVTVHREASFDRSNEIALSWHKVHVFVKPKKRSWNIFSSTTADEESRCILKNVSGKVEPGQLLAIMGASGAGKTTLMNVLTNRNLRHVEVTGEVKVNGFKAGSSLVMHSAYVQQDDMFIGTLTVREHLIFQAMLRMDRHLKYKERMAKVENAIMELGLTKCADTEIGIPGEKKGISGGERKRLAFASEVLTNPAVMFCDEPTSGLDSFMSMSIVSVMKKLARGGRTIICTIHQPSSEVYEMFDNVLLMAEGRVAYMGERQGAIPFFEKMGLYLPTNYNPADFFIFNLAVINGKEEACREQIQDFKHTSQGLTVRRNQSISIQNMYRIIVGGPDKRICDQFDKENEMNLEEEDSPTELPRVLDPKKTSRYKASWFMQLRALAWRSYLGVIREPKLTNIRTIQTIIVALMLGLIYYRQELNQRGIMNINGVMFLMLSNMSFMAMFAVINVFCSELPIFLREHANAMYRTDVYFLCKTAAEMPIFIFLPILFTSIMYWMVGLKPEVSAFFICVANLILVANTAASFGYMISCASDSVAMALSLGSPLNIPLMLFGGYFLNNASIAWYFLWIKYLAWYFYGNEVMAVNQWRDVTNITCELGSGACMPNGDAVLISLDFYESNLRDNLLMLLVLFLFYRIIAFVFLLIRSYKRT